MPITIPTTEEIRDQIIDDIESKLNQTVPLLPKSFLKVFATALAGVFTLVYKFGIWVFKQIFPQTSDSTALALQGERVGIFRKGATLAAITATETGTDGGTIPAGALYVGPNQIVYQVDTEKVISGGTATLNLTALTSGEVGNLNTGQTLSITQSIPDVDGVATVVTLDTEGEDAETDAEYRPRVIERYQLRPQGGSYIDYIQWAKSVAGITRAFAYRVDPGFVTVYPIEDGGVSRIPSAGKLTEVEDYINDPSRKPLQATVVVAAMTEVVVDIDITGLSPNTAEVMAAIDSNITEYLLSRQPQQFENEENLRNVISEATLTSIAVESGAQSLTLALEVDTVPVTSYTLENNELAILGVITYA